MSVLRARSARTCVIKELLLLKQVCKEWKRGIACLLADHHWMLSVSESAAEVCKDMTLQVAQLAAHVPWSEIIPPFRLSLMDDAEAHIFDENTQLQAVEFLYHVATESGDGGGGVLRRLVQQALAACKAHPQCARIQDMACHVAAAIARGRLGRQIISETDAVAHMVAVLARFGPSVPACTALKTVLFESDGLCNGNTERVVREGGVAVLMRLMAENPAARDFLVQGLECCHAFFHLDGLLEVLMGSEGAGVVFGAMERFPDSEEMQRAGMNVLARAERHRAVAAPDYVGTRARAALFLASARRFPLATEHAFLELAHHLLRTPKTSRTLMTLGLLPLVVERLRTASGHAARGAACRALARLSKQYPRKVAQADVGGPLCAVMRESKYSAVQNNACTVFANISVPLGRGDSAQAPPGAIPLVIASMQHAIILDHIPGVSAGLEALAAFIANGLDLQTVAQAGGARVLLESIRRFPLCPKFCTSALRALVCLCEHGLSGGIVEGRGDPSLACFHVFDRHACRKVRMLALKLMAILTKDQPALQAAFRARHTPDVLESWYDRKLQSAARAILLLCSA